MSGGIGKKRVLLVEDEALIALSEKLALERRGYEVLGPVARRLDEDALGGPQAQVGPEEAGRVGGEEDPPRGASRGLHAEPLELHEKYALQAQAAESECIIRRGFHPNSMYREAFEAQVAHAELRRGPQAPSKANASSALILRKKRFRFLASY